MALSSSCCFSMVQMVMEMLNKKESHSPLTILSPTTNSTLCARSRSLSVRNGGGVAFTSGHGDGKRLRDPVDWV